MCETLIGIYDKADDHTKQQLMKDLWNFQVHQEEEVVQAIARLNNIVAALARNGEIVTESTKVTRLLSALPEEYKFFCSAWDSTPLDLKTYKNLTQRLVLEEERWGFSKHKNSEALMSKSRECSCLQTRQAKKEVRCYKGKQKGHVKSKCPNGSNKAGQS